MQNFHLTKCRFEKNQRNAQKGDDYVKPFIEVAICDVDQCRILESIGLKKIDKTKKENKGR